MTQHAPLLQTEAASLAELAASEKDCRRCALWANATQTVCGEGDPHASVVLVGEQPGDQEDRAGRPFVGPAGKLLDRALAEAGIDRTKLYVTNAVKHFKNEPRGKFRLHKTPDTKEIEICRWWLDQELDLIRPNFDGCAWRVRRAGVERKSARDQQKSRRRTNV